MVFGDLDYPENSHKSSFSPGYARKLFGEAGFCEIATRPLPQWSGDMIIEARKSKVLVLRGLPEQSRPAP